MVILCTVRQWWKLNFNEEGRREQIGVSKANAKQEGVETRK